MNPLTHPLTHPTPDPVSEVALEAPWRSLLRFDELDSTQLLASRWVAEGRPMRGCVLWAERQSAGRGRLDHTWVSERGGLYMTAGLPYDLPLKEAETGWVCLLAALACAETLREGLGLEARIKWPNDVYFDGRKLAGVLGEMRTSKMGPKLGPSGAIPRPGGRAGRSPARLFLIGLGLNWLNRIRPAAKAQSFPAVSVGEFRPEITLPEREIFLLDWLGRMNAWHERFERDDAQALEALAESVESVLWRKGEWVSLRNTEKGSVSGILLGLGRGGGARLKQTQGRETLVHCGWQNEAGAGGQAALSKSLVNEA